eukprot:gene30297-39518_t
MALKAPTISPTSPTIFPTAPPPCSSPLNCFQINIPDFCVNTSIASKSATDISPFAKNLDSVQASSEDKLCLSNLVCKDFTILGFPSSYSPLQATTLNLGITGIGASCAGQFALTTSSIITSKSGSASISITSLNITLSIGVAVNATTTLPVSASFPTCNVSRSDITIRLKIGITPVQTIDPVKLEDGLQADLNNFICTNLTTTLSNSLTESLDPRLTSLVSQQADALPVRYTQAGEVTYLNWNEPSSLVNKAHALVDKVAPTAPPSSSTSTKRSLSPSDKRFTKRLSAVIAGKSGVSSSQSDECISIPVYSWMKDHVVLETSTSKIAVNTVQLCGLSSIETFYLLEPVSYSNVTLLSAIQWEYLSLELSVDLTSPSNSSTAPLSLLESLVSLTYTSLPPHTYTGTSSSKNYSESLTISLEVRNLTLALDLILAMDAQILNALYLDQIALGSGCWLSGSAGHLQSDIVALFDNIFLLLIEGFGSLLTDVIAGFAQGPLRSGLNSFLNETIAAAREENPCKAHNPDVDGYVYWQNNSFVLLFDKVVNDWLGDSGVNLLVDKLTNGTGATDIVLGQGGGAIDLALSGLDSFYEVSLLHPPSPTSYYLDNILALGQCDSSSCNKVVVTLESGVEGSSLQSALRYVIYDGNSDGRRGSRLGSGLDLSGFKLSVYLSNLRLSLALLLKVSLGELANLTFSQLGTTGCVASAVDTFALQSLQFNLSQIIVLVVVIVGASVGVAAGAGDSRGNRLLDCSVVVVSILGSCVRITLTSPFIVIVSSKKTSEESSLSDAHQCEPDMVIVEDASRPDTQTDDPEMDEDGQAGDAVLIANTRTTWWDRWDMDSALLFERRIPLIVRVAVPVILDALGKWSLIDFYVMILFLCAFYLQLKLGSNLLVKVTVLPKWGFDGFLLATMLSLSMGHIILACHRLLLEWESLSSMTYEVSVPSSSRANSTEQRLSLSMSYNALYVGDSTTSAPTYRPLHLQTDDASVPDPSNMTNLLTQNASKSVVKVRLTWLGLFLVIGLLVVATIFLIAGTNRLTTGFQFKGLTGLLLQSNAETKYSVIGVGLSAPEHSGVPNSFAIHWIQASFFLFCLGMPLALLAACLALWTCPMPLALFKQIFIQQFAAFIVGDSCDGINKLLEKFLDSQLDGDDLCFDVVAVLENDCWVLFLAAALLIVVGWPTLSLCSTAIQLRSRGLVATELQEPLLSEVSGADHEPEAKGEGGDGNGDIHRTPENNVGGDEGGVRSRGACCAGE